MHSIEDVHGAHAGYGLPFGHAGAGHDPDQLIGDAKFTNVANEVYQLLTGDSNAKLTAEHMTGLMNAIFQKCGEKGKLNNLTRPRTVGGGGGSGGGGRVVWCTLWIHIEYYRLSGNRIWIVEYHFFWVCEL